MVCGRHGLRPSLSNPAEELTAVPLPRSTVAAFSERVWAERTKREGNKSTDCSVHQVCTKIAFSAKIIHLQHHEPWCVRYVEIISWSHRIKYCEKCIFKIQGKVVCSRYVFNRHRYEYHYEDVSCFGSWFTCQNLRSSLCHKPRRSKLPRLAAAYTYYSSSDQYTVSQKKHATILLSISSPNIDRF